MITGGTGYDADMRYVELYRHTDNDGDTLTDDGIAAAEEIGRERLAPPYTLFGTSGAQRATQMVEILRRGAGQEDVPITGVPGLRSSVEDRWREASSGAGKGATVEYNFDNMHVEVPKTTGPDSPRATWKLDGTLRIKTTDRDNAGSASA